MKEKIKIEHKGLWIAALTVAVLVYAVINAAKVYIGYLDVAEIGSQYISVYLKNAKIQIELSIVSFMIAFTVTAFTNFIIKRNLLKWDSTAVFLKGKLVFVVFTAVFALCCSALLPGNTAQASLLAANPSWFLHSDPIFHKNIGYYVFQRPFFTNVSTWFLYVFMLLLAYSLVIYFMYYVRNGGGKISAVLQQSGIVTHLAVYILVVFVINGIGFNFSAEDVLFRETNGITGGGYTDINVWGNFYKTLPFLLIIIIAAAAACIIMKRPKLLITVILVYPLIWGSIGLYALVMENFIVEPSKAAMERPYIKYNIDYTNRAYGLDDVTETDYKAYGSVNERAIENNIGEINNIPVIDENAAFDMINKYQKVREEYRFEDADPIKYTDADGNSRMAYIAVREIDDGVKDRKSKTVKTEYNAKDLMKYTHGFGVVAGNANAADADGKMEFVIKDDANTSGLNITRPEVYFGEAKRPYAIVNTKQRELNSFEETTGEYTGEAGVRLNFLNRILYAFKYGDINIAISGDITSESRILTNCNIYDRVKSVMPFLEIDEDAQIAVTDDGRLVWLVDGYTTTAYYPYSQKTNIFKEKVNYVRSSVKIAVDAYDGSVTAYIIDWDDPIIRTYSNIYDGIFSSFAMRPDLAAQIKYPKRLFDAQANIYKQYHDTNPMTFYSKENAWEFSKNKIGASNEIAEIDTIYRLSGVFGNQDNMTLSACYTLRGNSNNLAGWLFASSDIMEYGKMKAYVMPANRYGSDTMQIENRIDNSVEISDELESLVNENTEIVKGAIKAVPVMNTVIYIKPVYVKSDSPDTAPELKRVIVANESGVAIGKSLAEAISKPELAAETVYNGEEEIVPKKDDSLNSDMKTMLSKALETYKNAKQFSGENDWINYGKAMKEFEDILNELEYGLTYPEEDTENDEIQGNTDENAAEQ